MRRILALTLLLMLSACASEPVATSACTDPRPLVCTMIFNPTCGVLAAGGTREFASPCTACADPAVSGYIAGPCPE
jgi:hypothetical protein